MNFFGIVTRSWMTLVLSIFLQPIVSLNAAVSQIPPLFVGWEAELRAASAEGILNRVNVARLGVLQQGYYDETPDALELRLDGQTLPPVPVERIVDLECRSWMAFAPLQLHQDFLPWARAGDTLRLVLRDERFYDCWAFPVEPWTLRVEVRTPHGELVTQADFKGQPFRSP